MHRLLLIASAVACFSPAAGQQEAAPPPEAVPAPPPAFPIGWLSDPSVEPTTFEEALLGGKVHLNNRFRIETADQTNLRSSTAITNRLRLGYGSKPFLGFSGYVDFENITSPAEDDYFVPQSGDGTRGRTVIADPPGSEINRAFARYQTSTLFGEGSNFEVKAGRQRIKLDDDRFIGNVGWRQFEQTFDAIRVRTDFGVDRLDFTYAYLWRVQRIFGPNGLNPDSDSHIIHAKYRVADELTVTPFVHLLDFKDDLPGLSSNTYGVRLTGDLFRDKDNEADVYADYEFTWAFQEDRGLNAPSYDATFIASQARVRQVGFGGVFLGQQFLSSDDGVQAFQFPLGTNHKFQGFADNFLTTPGFGLHDVYAGVSADLPWGIKGTVAYHHFFSDQGSDDLGGEFDGVATKKITPRWSVLAKFGFYDGRNGQPDIDRFWIQTTYQF